MRLFYSHSPDVANFIPKHDTARVLVRWSVLPIVGLSWMALHFGPWVTMVAGVFVVFLMFGGVETILRRKRLRRKA